MTETSPYANLTDEQLKEEIKRARLKAEQAGFSDMEIASQPLEDLISEKVRRSGPARRAVQMHRKMHEAAEEAEKAGTGYEGKGMPTQDKND